MNELESNIARANRNLMKEVTAEKISLSRASTYGASGTLIAIILVLLEPDTLDVALSVSLYCAVFSLPVFVALSIGTEAFLWFGEKTYSFYRELHHTQSYFLLILGAYIGLLISFLGIVAHFSFLALFVVSLLIFYLFTMYNQFHEKLTQLTEDRDIDRPNQ